VSFRQVLALVHSVLRAWSKEYRFRLLGLEVGHHRADEVDGARTRQAQDHSQRARSGTDRICASLWSCP
jgi:hypothetical protein